MVGFSFVLLLVFVSSAGFAVVGSLVFGVPVVVVGFEGVVDFVVVVGFVFSVGLGFVVGFLF